MLLWGSLSTNLVFVWASRELVTPRDLVPTSAWHKIPEQIIDVLNTTAEVLKGAKVRALSLSDGVDEGGLLGEGTSQLDSEDSPGTTHQVAKGDQEYSMWKGHEPQQENYQSGAVGAQSASKGLCETGDTRWVKIMTALSQKLGERSES